MDIDYRQRIDIAVKELQEHLKKNPNKQELLDSCVALFEKVKKLHYELDCSQHLPLLLSSLSPVKRNNEAVDLVLALKGLRRASIGERAPGRFWMAALRHNIDEKTGSYYDELTGLPLVVEREVDGAPMVLVPSGPFIYGPPPSYHDEKQWATTGLFYIDRYEITRSRFRSFLLSQKQNSNELEPCFLTDDHPMTRVSWHMAQAYGKWAGARLPYEIEWEKAARGTDGRTYPWGEKEPSCQFANYFRDDNTNPYVAMSQGPGSIGRHRDGDSPFGAADMIGNVWEWMLDTFEDTDCHPVRGSSYDDFGRGLKVYYRHKSDSHSPDHLSREIGFRLVVPMDSRLPHIIDSPM